MVDDLLHARNSECVACWCRQLQHIPHVVSIADVALYQMKVRVSAKLLIYLGPNWTPVWQQHVI